MGIRQRHRQAFALHLDAGQRDRPGHRRQAQVAADLDVTRQLAFQLGHARHQRTIRREVDVADGQRAIQLACARRVEDRHGETDAASAVEANLGIEIGLVGRGFQRQLQGGLRQRPGIAVGVFAGQRQLARQLRVSIPALATLLPACRDLAARGTADGPALRHGALGHVQRNPLESHHGLAVIARAQGLGDTDLATLFTTQAERLHQHAALGEIGIEARRRVEVEVPEVGIRRQRRQRTTIMLTRLVEPTLEGQPQTRKRHFTGHLGIELQGVIAQEASQRQRDCRDLLSASSDIIGIQGDIQCRVINPPLASIDPG